MVERHVLRPIGLAVVTALVCASHCIASELPAPTRELLQSSPYVYIASQRKSGEFGQPAEIWFFYHEGALWVATAPTSWRVRRIRAGRTLARIAVGKPDGPSFEAIGAIQSDPQVAAAMLDTYAAKYAGRWAKYEKGFRVGIKDGSRVLVKYVPK